MIDSPPSRAATDPVGSPTSRPVLPTTPRKYGAIAGLVAGAVAVTVGMLIAGIIDGRGRRLLGPTWMGARSTRTAIPKPPISPHPIPTEQPATTLAASRFPDRAVARFAADLTYSSWTGSPMRTVPGTVTNA